MNVILLGPPGTGKGTQAKRLERVLNVPHIASGDILRLIRVQDTPLGLKVREHMDRGDYVPDDLTIELVLARLCQPDAAQGFLLDGFPRTARQAEALDVALTGKGQKVDKALYITAPTDLLVKRVTGRLVCPLGHAIYNEVTKPPKFDMQCDICGRALERRSDEAPEVVRRRLETYAQQTMPVVEHYKSGGNLLEVDGSRSIDEVEAQVDRGLGVETPV